MKGEPKLGIEEEGSVGLGLAKRYSSVIEGELRCWDRMVFTGTWTDVCHVGAMEGRLRAEGIRFFDLKEWAESLKDAI